MKSQRISQKAWRRVKSLLLSAAALGVASAFSPAFAQPYEPPGFDPNSDAPRTYYVSKNGNNTDGRSWATAWNEMNQIQWSQISVQRQDQLVIDGGARRMIYNTPMKPQLAQTYYGTVPVNLSSDAGHNGQCVIMPPLATLLFLRPRWSIRGS